MLRFATCWLALTLAGAAQAEALGTDRPDFVESSDVVGKGRFQLETSVAGERDRAGGTTERTFATPTLLRLGVSDAVELRLETDGAQRKRTHDDATGITTRDRGWADTSIGLKWHLRDGDEKSGRPGIAVLLHADLDSGSRAFRGNGVRPSARAVFEWELPNDFSIGAMPGVFFDRNDDGKRYAGAIAAVTLGRDWLDGRVHGFVELAGQRLARQRDGGSVVSFDFGASWKITDNVQIDAACFAGANRNAPDLAWTTGVSIRF